MEIVVRLALLRRSPGDGSRFRIEPDEHRRLHDLAFHHGTYRLAGAFSDIFAS